MLRFHHFLHSHTLNRNIFCFFLWSQYTYINETWKAQKSIKKGPQFLYIVITVAKPRFWSISFVLVCLIAKSCWALCDPMDCTPPGFSVHGISQARIPDWVAISSSTGSSWPRDWTLVFCIGRRILYSWATRERLCMCYIRLLISSQFLPTLLSLQLT